MVEYAPEWRRSLDDPHSFWLDAASAVDWTVVPQRAVDHHHGDEWTWFPDAALNMSVNCLDRHVDAGRGEHVALRYHSAMTGTRKDYTYAAAPRPSGRVRGRPARIWVSRAATACCCTCR